MKHGESTIDKNKRPTGKPMPISGSDFCLLTLSISLCGLWLLFPSAPAVKSHKIPEYRFQNEEATFSTPDAAYVQVVFDDKPKDYLFGQNLPDNDLVNDEFALQTTLPLPATLQPDLLELPSDTVDSINKIDVQEKLFCPYPSISDLPAPPVHPYADTFTAISNPVPVLTISPALLDAGFAFVQPTNTVSPYFSFNATLSFNDKGNVQILLVDTQVSSSEFLPWQNALMLATATNSVSGKISFQ